jgi:hypothetical protein
MPKTDQQKAIALRGAATKACYETIVPAGKKGLVTQSKTGKGLGRKIYDCVEAALRK